MRENPFTFNPHHKMFFDCNHRPVITNPADPVWNRIKCVPFNVQIPKSDIDTDLLEKMKAELPGILAWIVRGTKLYLKEGLSDNVPDSVQEATDEYRNDSYRLRGFFLEVVTLLSLKKGSGSAKLRSIRSTCDGPKTTPKSILFPKSNLKSN
jgi:putative DNA primase/helicase